MASEIYNQNISVFIFNENIYLARAIKDRLVSSQYEVQFYTDEHLLRQSVYLALPHIVIMPSHQQHEKLIFDIRKMSREIQIIVLAPEEDYEAVLALKRKGLVNDFIVDPLKYLDTIPYRVDLASERWILLSQVEERGAHKATTTDLLSLDKDNLFSQQVPQIDLSADSILSAVISADTDVDAIKVCIEKLSAFLGKSFAYFDFDAIREFLILRDVSFGMRKELEGLGISLENSLSVADFFKAPQEQAVLKAFMRDVFSVDEFFVTVLEHGDDTFGCLVSLKSLNPEAVSVVHKVTQALTLKIDNAKKTRWLHNYVSVDRDFECFSNKFFYSKLSEEISRARRLSLPLTLLVFDVSCTKRAQLKHSASTVSKVLKRFTRCTDYVGRVGSTRFGVLLSHCSLDAGIEKAKRLQTIIKAALSENQLTDAIVRSGVTSFPDQQSDAMGLLDAAEKACLLSEGFDVCVMDMDDSKVSLRDRIKNRIKGASL